MLPRPRVLPIGAGLAINGNKLTDHNRTPISITPERIENRKRMANGTLRNFVVAQKVKIKTSWDNLPRQNTHSVDGFWGAESMINFYNNTFDEFTLTVTYGDNSTKDFLVMFADFSPVLRKRSGYTDLYSIDVTFEEV
jgi:hypothetical protein